ncbi:exodeoxyribonuclease I [Wenzhouxiangella marina]|uniref:Exodeoxyribonuclease I n=1 Tax=Wenzhouxiangella marina TaxID=1579979 RepID=A0A0K0XXW7_9GAMM|nr:exodeoxyribonuclease I [Wenzhouxiangella marina]AKS42520.1 Exodeoxyribonuclease I [Wenzhouxiangella marina]MBB6085703.1 exodeoxyribonuclease-1 [Wenzhouxiangella marina]
MTESSFLWHDFETFGADPRRDRPVQFAALRTNEALEPIGEPIVVYCQPDPDLLPQPQACLITGITPQLARDKGLSEPAFAAEIHAAMSQPGTCSVGYNNFRFDDEVTRYLFWRNFYEPYAREYSNGNSRFDLIDLMRMTRALRPEGLEWADREDGMPSFRLEDLAAANGLDTSRAHDALADVEATLGLARALKTQQPRLWQWALSLRQKHVVARLLEPRQPLLHSSARFPASHFATAPILPLLPHPDYAGQWIVWNLQIDPEPFDGLSVDDLADRLWVSQQDLPPGVERLPVKLVRTNRCPMLSPINVLDEAARERLDIDPGRLEQHARKLAERPELLERIRRLFSQSKNESLAVDPEQALYDGFVSRSDQALYASVREADPDTLTRLGQPFQDDRLNELLFRYRARKYPDSLDEDEATRWQEFRARRLFHDPELASIQWPGFEAEMHELMRQRPDQRPLLEALAEWGQAVKLRNPG